MVFYGDPSSSAPSPQGASHHIPAPRASGFWRPSWAGDRAGGNGFVGPQTQPRGEGSLPVPYPVPPKEKLAEVV